MLTYYPYADLYVAGTLETGYTCIDRTSQAYTYCEYLRTKFGAIESTDLDGEPYIIINVSEYRVIQLSSYADLADTIHYLMERGL